MMKLPWPRCWCLLTVLPSFRRLSSFLLPVLPFRRCPSFLLPVLSFRRCSSFFLLPVLPFRRCPSFLLPVLPLRRCSSFFLLPVLLLLLPIDLCSSKPEQGLLNGVATPGLTVSITPSDWVRILPVDDCVLRSPPLSHLLLLTR